MSPQDRTRAARIQPEVKHVVKETAERRGHRRRASNPFIATRLNESPLTSASKGFFISWRYLRHHQPRVFQPVRRIESSNAPHASSAADGSGTAVVVKSEGME